MFLGFYLAYVITVVVQEKLQNKSFNTTVAAANLTDDGESAVLTESTPLLSESSLRRAAQESVYSNTGTRSTSPVAEPGSPHEECQDTEALNLPEKPASCDSSWQSLASRSRFVDKPASIPRAGDCKLPSFNCLGPRQRSLTHYWAPPLPAHQSTPSTPTERGLRTSRSSPW